MRADSGRWAPMALWLVALVSLSAPWPALARHGASAQTITEISAALGADKISVRLRIADDHYLLANQIRVESPASGIEFGEPELAPAERHRDPLFGDIDVYRGEVVLSLPYRIDALAGAGAARRIAFTLWSQGCDSSGNCSPVEVTAEAIRGASAAPAGIAEVAPALARLLELGQGAGIDAGGEVEFLDPDIAFVLNAVPAGPGAVGVRWDIAEGYYLYRDKFRFQGAGESGAALGEARLPKGIIKDDEYFGPMEVYYDSVAALIPVTGAGAAVDVDITYQGCAEAGLCYPPITKTVSLLLAGAPASPGGGAASGSGAGSAGLSGAGLIPGAQGAAPIELPEQDRIAAALASGNRWLVILSLFGAGLLLAFTPCVLPMVPILTSLIVGQGTARGGAITSLHAFMLSFVYVLAMALTYAVAGVVTGLLGANFTAAFQDPWIVSGFALVFVLLSLSMFGFYDLQIPASWQTRLAAISHRQAGGTYIGVGVMGVLSALIVGPCVAAPLAGVLIYIGQTGDPVLGGVALFTLGMGMGVPLIVAGVSAGKLLPKAGAWTNAVKSVFGMMLLAVAIYLLERVVPEPVSLLMWAALLIVASIYLGALDTLTARSGGWRRLRKGAGLVMLVYGVLVMVGIAAGQGDLLRPLQGITLAGGERAGHELAFKRVKGIDGLNAELSLAAARGQVVMLDYYADWCVSCKEMERFTFGDPAVQEALAGVLLLQTDVTENDALDRALLAEFGLFGPPAILFFGPDARERRELRVVGFMNADDFRRVVERATAPTGALRASRSHLQRRS